MMIITIGKNGLRLRIGLVKILTGNAIILSKLRNNKLLLYLTPTATIVASAKKGYYRHG